MQSIPKPTAAPGQIPALPAVWVKAGRAQPRQRPWGELVGGGGWGFRDQDAPSLPEAMVPLNPRSPQNHSASVIK